MEELEKDRTVNGFFEMGKEKTYKNCSIKRQQVSFFNSFV
jgi:hypothetical protein